MPCTFSVWHLILDLKEGLHCNCLALGHTGTSSVYKLLIWRLLKNTAEKRDCLNVWQSYVSWFIMHHCVLNWFHVVQWLWGWFNVWQRKLKWFSNCRYLWGCFNTRFTIFCNRFNILRTWLIQYLRMIQYFAKSLWHEIQSLRKFYDIWIQLISELQRAIKY